MDSGLKQGGDGDSNVKLDFTKLSPTINQNQHQDIKLFTELSHPPHLHLLKHPLSEVSKLYLINQFMSVYNIYVEGGLIRYM